MSSNYEYESNSSFRLSLKFWIVALLLCSILGIGLGFAKQYYENTHTDVVEKEELGATISLNFEDTSNAFRIEDFTPTKDYIGKSSGLESCYDFTVDVHMKQATNVTYELSLKKRTISTIDDSYVHIYLEKMDSNKNYVAVFQPMSFKMSSSDTEIGTKKGTMLLNREIVTESRKDYYRLRMWMTEGSTITTGEYTLEVLLNAKAY